MDNSKLDEIVKGALPSDKSPTQVAASAKAPSQHSSITAPVPPATKDHDPRDVLPSSPPQIYLNLLILEASIRLQYLTLRARLRLHMLLLAGLASWIATFTYLLYFRPREDGVGVGGSVYWVLETTYKFAWGIGVVTACLFYATGMYERGLRWPRKFIGSTNRGMRQFNLKVVITRDSLFHELYSWFGAGWWGESRSVSYHVLPQGIDTLGPKDHWNMQAKMYGFVDEDLAPAGDVLRILLLPKPFSPDFREGWDNFRAEYWERENARRAELRAIVTARKRDVARREGGMLWWTGWRGWRKTTLFGRKTRRQLDLEKLALREQVSFDRFKHSRRRDANLLDSRSSSRSTTPTPDPEGRRSRRGSETASHTRRGSSGAMNSGSLRRPRRSNANAASRLSATETILQDRELSPMTKLTDDPIKQENGHGKPLSALTADAERG